LGPHAAKSAIERIAKAFEQITGELGDLTNGENGVVGYLKTAWNDGIDRYRILDRHRVHELNLAIDLAIGNH
jgi:hypothetical protein